MPKEVKLSANDVHILDVCLRIEETCANLYRYFAGIHGDIPGAGALWEKTAKEEDSHAEHFRLACRLQGSGMESLKIDTSKAADLHARIQSVFDGVQKKPPTYKEALQFAVKLERSLADYHMSVVANFQQKSLERLFATMMKCDVEHQEMLEHALQELEGEGWTNR
jgi:rubrerythrin